jgi:SnoaL-like domain
MKRHSSLKGSATTHDRVTGGIGTMTVQTGSAPLTRQKATELWQRWLAMWNGRPEVAHDIIGPEYVVHLPTAGATIDPSRVQDAAGMAAWVGAFRAKFDGLRYHTDIGPLVDGDKLICRWYGTATYQGRTGWPGDVPGRPVTMVGVDILRVVGDRIVECWTQGAEA